MNTTSLRCNYLVDPIGIDDTSPILSWQLESNGRRGARQTRYQIVAASSAAKLVTPDLWDSGETISDVTQVTYSGIEIESRQQVWWRVKIWDENAVASDWSEPACFEIGLLAKEEWKAEWIGAGLAGGRYTTVPAPYLRREFQLESPVVSARLYASALGLYECELNGQRVGHLELTPGWTDYNTRVQYQVYDVTDLLNNGENTWGAMLGDGWYCGHVEWRGRQYYGESSWFYAQLEVTYADGSRQIITSDERWKTTFGPILESDMLMGESYDARREMTGWSQPDFDDSSWLPVQKHPDQTYLDSIQLSAMLGTGVVAAQELKPVAITQLLPPPLTQWVFDMGQNMVGRVRLNLPEIPNAKGQTITLRFAEMINADGTLYTENLRKAKQTDYYTRRGGAEVWEPRFTFHGFRYVEVSGLDVADLDTLTGVVLHSEMAKTGDFECSDELVNQLHKNTDWGWRGNAVDVPTDCPQRDERLGWTGDAQVFVRTAASIRDVAGFFRKWQRDLRDAQVPSGSIPPTVPSTAIFEAREDGGPAWSDAIIVCPWTMYLCYGDKEILREHYESMQAFIRYLERTSPGYIRCHPSQEYHTFGDHLAVGSVTPHDIIGTAFFAYSARLLSQIAEVLGEIVDSVRYQELFCNVRRAFQERFVTNSGLISGGTQTSYVLALHFDLLPEEFRSVAVDELVRDIEKRGDRLSTGFVGSPYLTRVLSDNGRADVAYRLLHQQQWPSWLYAVTQGATTIWEHWDGWTHDKGFQHAEMNSFNHYAYGAVTTWLYTSVAGIDVDEEQPAFKNIVLRPNVGGHIEWAKAHIDSIHGRIFSSWRKTGDSLLWHIVVPPNTTATVSIPATIVSHITENGSLLEDTLGIANLRREENWLVGDIQSGTYSFTVQSAAHVLSQAPEFAALNGAHS